MASSGRTITIPEGVSMEQVQQYLSHLQVTEAALSADTTYGGPESDSEPEDVEIEITAPELAQKRWAISKHHAEAEQGQTTMNAAFNGDMVV